MRFIKYSEATNDFPDRNKVVPRAKNYYTFIVYNDKATYLGQIVLGFKDRKGYMIKAALRQYNAFVLEKIVSFAEKWVRSNGCTSLELQFTLKDDELKGKRETLRTRLFALCKKRGYRVSKYFREALYMKKLTVKQSDWVTRQVNIIDTKGYVPSEKYQVLRYGELTDEQLQYMVATEKQYFPTYLSCKPHSNTDKQLSFAVFKGKDFVGYILCDRLGKDTVQIASMATRKGYMGAAMVALERFVYCLHVKIAEDITIMAEYTPECVDGKRMFKALLGNNYYYRTMIMGYVKNFDKVL